ncbi:MAG: PIN domain-containing protein [Lachnospiraceae bacterium]|nr:PIN domain-containing protein [Lachnospiraceae bacterium]
MQGYASALTFANLIYIMRKQLDAKGIHDVLNKMQMIFHIAALSEAELKQASEMEWKDFEDAIQCATAERIGADFIITRNVKDFLQSRKVSALTPAEFLERYF